MFPKLEKVIFLDTLSFKKYKRYGPLIGGSGKMRSKSVHFYLVLISQTICPASRPPAPKSAMLSSCAKIALFGADGLEAGQIVWLIKTI